MPAARADYDAFLSYAMRSDYTRARQLEAFLESIVTRAGLKDAAALRICRDGSDFRLPARRDEAAQQDEVARTIDHYLDRSRRLVVLCSRASVDSPWVDHEVRWFLEHRRADDILLAVTEGDDPQGAPERVFPKAVIEAGLHRRIWYDLRGVRAPRNEEDERVRLAAELLEWDETARGPLLAVWQREEIRRKRAQIWIAAGVAVMVIILAAVALQQRQTALRRLADATLTSVRLLTYSGRFNEAHAMLGNGRIDDARLALSAWLAEQQRSYPTSSFDPLKNTFVHESAIDDSGRTIAAMIEAGRSNLIAIDARTMKRIGSAADLPRDIEMISAVRGRPNEFLFVGEHRIIHGTMTGTWQLRALALPAEVRDPTWFAGGERGLAIRGSTLVAIRRDGDRVILEQEFAGAAGANQYLIASPDGTMLGLAQHNADERVAGVVHITRLFVAQSGTVEELALEAPILGRILGDGFVAALEQNDTLSITRPADDFAGRTREIFYKPWLGFAAGWRHMVLVQEVGDVDQHAVARISFLDPASGRDVIEGCTVEEPIAGFGIDPRGVLYFISQSDGIASVDTTAPRARIVIFSRSIQPPVRVRGHEILVRTGDALSGTLWSVDVRTLAARAIALDEVTSFDIARDGAILIGTMYGLRSRERLADSYLSNVSINATGDRILLTTISDHALVDRAGVVLRRFPAEGNTHPVTSVRWLNAGEVLLEDFHGGASILDVRTGRDRELPLGSERVTAVSPRGECLITAQSGSVRRLTSTGELEEIARIRDLRSLFSLDEAHGIYVGEAEQPSRIAFFRLTGKRLEEAGALPTTDHLRDALVVDGKVVLMLNRSLVVYPLPLPR